MLARTFESGSTHADLRTAELKMGKRTLSTYAFNVLDLTGKHDTEERTVVGSQKVP